MSEIPAVHGSAVRVGPWGVLIRGDAGSGKSALALALLAASRDNRLIADDRVHLAASDARVIAAVPDSIAGLIEVRGQGIIRRPHISPVEIHLVVDLRPLAGCPRMPEPEEERTEVAGIDLPRLVLPIGAADGALRVAIAIERLVAKTG